MKYIIASNTQDQALIEDMVDDPIAHALKFEPIDVINGQMIIWDENGKLYSIVQNYPVNPQSTTKRIQTVEVGSWDNNMPHLILKKAHDTSGLREALEAFLRSPATRPWWKRWKNFSDEVDRTELQTLSLADLVNVAHAKLERQ